VLFSRLSDRVDDIRVTKKVQLFRETKPRRHTLRADRLLILFSQTMSAYVVPCRERISVLTLALQLFVAAYTHT